LPVVATRGDATSDLIAAYALGIQVDPNDVAGVAAAIATLVDEAPNTRVPAFAHARAELTWERAVAPLAAFCRAPRHAPDRKSWLPDSDQVEKLQAEVAHWRTLVTRYEQGRFMRAMRGLDRLKRRLWIQS
jgi:hypothetical protein